MANEGMTFDDAWKKVQESCPECEELNRNLKRQLTTSTPAPDSHLNPYPLTSNQPRFPTPFSAPSSVPDSSRGVLPLRSARFPLFLGSLCSCLLSPSCLPSPLSSFSPLLPHSLFSSSALQVGQVARVSRAARMDVRSALV